MKKFQAIVLGAAIAAAAGSAAQATDITPIMPAPVTEAPAAPPTFGWGGLYAGPVLSFYNPFGGGTLATMLGGAIGYNMVSGSLVFGGELQAEWFHYIGGGEYFFGTALLRAGFALGAEQRLLLYGAAGVGFYTPFTTGYFLLAGGAELGVGDAVSLRAEARMYRYFSGGVYYAVGGGLLWHFGGP